MTTLLTNWIRGDVTGPPGYTKLRQRPCYWVQIGSDWYKLSTPQSKHQANKLLRNGGTVDLTRHPDGAWCLWDGETVLECEHD